MNKKRIEYNEIGILPKLRKDYNDMKSNQLDRACEALQAVISNPVNVYQYQSNLRGGV